MNHRYNQPLHLFAVFTAFCTFFLIVAGGLVTSTGSGLAVPDWPLSYGKVMPPMVGGIFYEHGHRMVATFVGFLTVILAIWLWKRESRRWLRFLGVVALAAVIAQGLLGGLTVLFLLPTAISVSHATLAQTFFCIVAAIAFFTSRWWIDAEVNYEKQPIPLSTFTLMLFAFGSIYIQLILGALMRHTASGLVVPDFPLAYGQILPNLSKEAVSGYNQILIHEHTRLAADGPLMQGQVIIHLLHRYWAMVVSALLIWSGVRLLRLQSLPNRFRILGTLLMVLLTIQITLGAFTIWSHRDVLITTSHVANGALMLVIMLLTLLHASRYAQLPQTNRLFVWTRREAIA
jgi:cytochrome c oxidase assembly protein subunit 15